MSGLAIVLVVLQMSQTQPVCVFLKGELWFIWHLHTQKKKDKEEEKIFKNLQRIYQTSGAEFALRGAIEKRDAHTHV